MKEEIKQIVQKAAGENISDFSIEVPDDRNHGDYSTNIALILAKKLGKNPVEIANLIKEKIGSNNLFSKIEVANGFINFFISKKYLQEQIKEILKQKNEFGSLKIGKDQKIYPVKSARGGAKQFNRVNVEFISANPTGPLTLGNGRGGFCGDALSNVFKRAGYKVCKEYYINDTGEQIKKLGHSVLGDEQAVYKGAYIDELRKKLLGRRTSQLDAGVVGKKAAKIIFDKTIKPTVKRMGIKFDVWFLEKDLYNKGKVDQAIEELTKKGFTYKSEGAVWFKSKELEDDKDRVLIRTDGIRTYFASDIAYLKNKIERGFKKIILFLGADHYGYVARLKAAAHVLGFDKENLNAIVMQLVRLLKDGQEVRMSKRAGTYVTLDELLDEVGLDIARFFFLQRSANTHLSFDLNLAKEQSQKNPVYYVQYAHARICSILRKSRKNFQFFHPRRTSLGLAIFNFQSNPNFQLLNEMSELNLIKQLIKLPEIIEDTAKDFQVQRLPQYAMELADAFHQFYENCRVISKDKNLSAARLKLVLATKIVLKNTLDLMGISSPEKM